ncbi:MAG: aminomethyltransferase beta-barrel domain-containing protein [Chloroflexota bacterium]
MGTPPLFFKWAPALGQSAVFYNGDRVIGGGVIALRP